MEYDIDKRGLALYEDKAKLFKMFWPSALGWVLIIPLILASISKKRKLRSFSIIGIIAVFIWEALVMYPWQRLLFPKPILTIDDTGIAYSPIMPWYINLSMKIRWEEITKIYPIELSTGSKKRMRTLRCIGIFPKDSNNFFQTLLIPKYLEKYLQKVKSSMLSLLLMFTPDYIKIANHRAHDTNKNSVHDSRTDNPTAIP